MRCRRDAATARSTLKKAPLWGAFFVCALSWSGLLQAACPLLSGGQEVQVRQVVDGDTLRLADGRSVRLIGVNTPELRGARGTPEPYAEAARRRLVELVDASRQQVRLVVGTERTDRHGRLLAHVYDGQDRNLETLLIGEGLGYAVAIAPNTTLADCQMAAQAEARRAHLGIWRRDPSVAAEAIDQGGFAVVHGRLERVERNRGGLWLELAGDLVVNVPAQWTQAFDERALERWVGHDVEARGWIADRSRRKESGRARWQMTLSDPRMLGPVAESF